MTRAAESFLVSRSARTATWQKGFNFSTVLLFYAIRGYAERIFVALCGILAIAMSMEIVDDWNQLTRTAAAEGQFIIARVALYLGLSAIDITTNLLAISVFLGVIWWELRHTRLRERIIVWNGGQSPVQSLAAPLLLALVLASIQLCLDLRIRPVALALQMEAGLGELGQRYDRRLSSHVSWAKVGGDIMSARIDYGAPTVLYDLTLYRLSEENRLVEIVKARRALQTPTESVWRVEDPVRWPIGTSMESVAARNSDFMLSKKSDTERLVLNLDPRIFRLHDISAKYLPQPVLQQLAAQESTEPPVSDYKTWLNYRYARGVVTGLMALLAATLALFDNGIVRPRAKYLIIFLSGYAAYSMVKLFVTMGELGFLPAVAAAWGGPLLIVVTIAALQLMMRRKII